MKYRPPRRTAAAAAAVGLAAALVAVVLLLARGDADAGTGPGAASPTLADAGPPPPPPVPVAAEALAEVEARLRREVERESFPGAVVAVGNRNQVQRVEGFGRTHWADTAAPVDPAATLYDLASLTKAVATTAAVMALVEDGRMELDAPVSRWVEAYAEGDKAEVTVRQLLTHTAGTAAGLLKKVPDAPRDRVLARILALDLALPPGQDVLYSDIGFVVLWEAARAAAGEPLQDYLRRRVWGPLGMEHTRVGVSPGCPECAPTLYLEEKKEPYRGGSFDLVGRRMEGVTGNAGAFSTAADLARFAAMMAGEGRLGDVRVFRPETVRAFTTPQPGAGTRALGWEVYCAEGIVPDHRGCERVWAYGHTGVTGASLWVHAETGTWVVLLANPTYLPRDEPDMQELRRDLLESVAESGA